MAYEQETSLTSLDDAWDDNETFADVVEKSTGSELEQIISSSSFKTSNRISSVSSNLQIFESDAEKLRDLHAEFDLTQKELETLKREFGAVIRDLSEIERMISDQDASRIGFSNEILETLKDAVIHQEAVRFQKLVTENGLLRTRLALSEKARREFRDRVEVKLGEDLKEKIEREIELNCAKKKLEETQATNEELRGQLEKYRSKSREARSSLSDTIMRIRSTISGQMDIEERKSSNFSLNESLLAYWELI